MSWGFSLSVKCGEKDVSIEGYYANYTYNVSAMFRQPDVLGENGIRRLDKMLCRNALPPLTAAIDVMAADPTRFQKMNPENGWGDYDGALALLRTLREWCEEYPEAYLRVE